MFKISIITVVYNDVSHIEETINSVLSQVYTDVEYLIIDGGSNDGTLNLIEKYQSRLSYFISERDSGIYDAMNKGIHQAKGDWLLFLNSGDILSNEHILLSVKDLLDENTTIAYGDVRATSEEIEYQFDVKAGLAKGLLDNMVMNHQSCFIKRDWHLKNNYNLNYKIASDYHFMLRSFLAGRSFKYFPITISVISTGGLSDANRIRTFKEILRIKNELNKTIWNYLYYSKQLFYFLTIESLKRVIPGVMYQKLYKLKYKKQ